jgi:hypothetical protein
MGLVLSVYRKVFEIDIAEDVHDDTEEQVRCEEELDD